MTDDKLQAIEARAVAEVPIDAVDMSAYLRSRVDSALLVAEVRRLRLTLAGIAGLGGPAGEVAGQALWTDAQREEWALLRRAQREAARMP